MSEYTHHLTVITKDRALGNALAYVLSGKTGDLRTFDNGIQLIKFGESKVSAWAATVYLTTGGAVVVKDFLYGDGTLLAAKGADPVMLAAARECLICEIAERGTEQSAKAFFAANGYTRKPHDFVLPTAEVG